MKQIFGKVSATSHGCMCDSKWRELIDGSVLADQVGLTRGTRGLVRVVCRGEDTMIVSRLSRAVTISGNRYKLKALKFVYDSDRGDPDSPRTLWISAPRGFDFGSFFNKTFDGAVPTELEWEIWDKKKFCVYVAEAKNLCMTREKLLAVLEDLDDHAERVVISTVIYDLGLRCEFIWSMVAHVATRVLVQDPRFESALFAFTKEMDREDENDRLESLLGL